MEEALTTVTVTQHELLVQIIKTAKLHPLAHDVWTALADALPESPPLSEPAPTEPAEARAFLVGVAHGVLTRGREPGSAYLINLAALALITLAVNHRFARTRAACRVAEAEVLVLLESPERLAVIRPLVRQLLSDVRDGVSLDEGRRTFVYEVRGELKRLAVLHPRVLDVLPRSRRLTVGGVELTCGVTGSRLGRQEDPPLTAASLPGQLLLLIAAGVPDPESRRRHPAVVWWARQAIANATQGMVELREDLELAPGLLISARARRAVEEILLGTR